MIQCDKRVVDRATREGGAACRRLIARTQAGRPPGALYDAVQAVLHQRPEGDPYRAGFLAALLHATRPRAPDDE